MKKLRKAELAVVAVTLLVLVFTAGYFTGKSSGDHVIRFDQLPPSSQSVAAPIVTAPAVNSPAGAPAISPSAAPGAAASPAASATPLASASVPAPLGQVNINTATLSELDALPGIGQVLAKSILDYRQKVGGFKSTQQLMDVDGIGEKKFEAIKNMITVG